MYNQTGPTQELPDADEKEEFMDKDFRHKQIENSDDEKTISQQLAEESTDSDDVERYEIKKIAKKQKRQQYTGTYRCNLDAIYKVMSIIKEKHILSPEAKAFLEKTPFKNFFNVFLRDSIARQDLRKSASNLDDIITSFDEKQNAFKIGNKLLKISPEEVSLIFGMPLAGEDLFPIPASNKASAMESFSNFLTANFQEEDIISQKTVTKRLNTLLEEEKGNEDLVKLLLLLLVITFLFPNNQSYMQWGFLSKLLN